MFQKARKELHKQLKKYTFSLVTRGITIPPDCVLENGEVSHYYTTSDELPVASTARKGCSVWIKKKARYRHHQLGPVFFTGGQDIPKVGDVVFGEMFQVANSERKFGKQSVKAERQSYKWWTCPGAPLYYLATMVLKGTSETEESLRKLLKLSDDYDDLWMLARVILFNNVQCFADMLNPQLQSVLNIKLHDTPVQFVHQLSTWLNDLTIFTEFKKLLPEIMPQTLPPLASSTSQLPPLSAVEPLPVKQFVGRKRRQSSGDSFKQDTHHRPDVNENKEYDPDEPGYDFSHRKPAAFTSAPGIYSSKAYSSYPQSPPYQPRSPPYQPQSPPYQPQSPPYQPQSPPYQPQSPPYQPRSPPYQPQSPPYQPRSPPYQPRSPPYEPFTPPPMY
jgi:hypothetical protein